MNRRTESSRTSKFHTASPGMALSVTRHAQIAGPSDWRFLAAGVDSLDVGGFVHWDEHFSKLVGVLTEKKAAASGTQGILCPLANCLILPSGKPPNYNWHLEYPEFHLFIGKSSRPRNQTPNVYVSINSLTLWDKGLYASLELVSERIAQLGGELRGSMISRIDLSTDFLLSEDLTYDYLKATRVSRSRRINSIEDGEKLETFYVGAKSSPIQVRIYNKGLEVQQGGTKTWFLKVWDLKECDGVWRIEYQIRRQTLKAYRIDSPDDLMSKLGEFWLYLTGKWLSLRSLDNTTTTRRTVEPFWVAVQNASQSFGVLGAPLERDLSSVPADVKTCLAQIAGRVMTYAARTNCGSLPETVDRLKAELTALLTPEDFDERLQIKRIQMGRPPCRHTSEPYEDSNHD